MSKLEDIIKKYDLSTSNIDEIRMELKKKLKPLHPDKNRGEFISETDEKAYLDIGKDLEMLDNLNKNQHLVALETNELISLMSELIIKKDLKDSLKDVEEKYDRQIEKNTINIKNTFKGFKISNSVFSTILGIIFLFPEKVTNNPILKNAILITDREFVFLWIFMIYITIIVWTCLFMIEKRTFRILSKLSSESYQNSLFNEFLSKINSQKKNSFLKDDFKSFIINKSHSFKNDFKNFTITKSHFLYYIEDETYGKLTEIIINRAIEKKIIKEVNDMSMDMTYTILA